MEKEVTEKYQKQIDILAKRMNRSITMLLDIAEHDAVSIGDAVHHEKEFVLEYIKDCPIEKKMFILKQLV